jgi:hypothetical protein
LKGLHINTTPLEQRPKVLADGIFTKSTNQADWSA